MKAFLPSIALLFVLATGCASSSGSRRDFKNQDEEEFFVPLSERDRSRPGGDCQCDYKKDNSYFNAGQSSNGTDPAAPAVQAQGSYSGESQLQPASGLYFEEGMASWYGREFDGEKTASGELFDARRLTAAHRTLPLGSVVAVKNLDNGKEVVVTINDRGPYVQNRILDLSEYGAELLDYKRQGLARVGLKIIREGNSREGQAARTPASSERYAGSEESSYGSSYNLEERLDTSYGTAPAGGANNARTAEEPARVERFATGPGQDTGYRNEARAHNGFSVQAGVFSSSYNAEQFRDSLKHFRQPVFVVRQGDRYQVRIGDFKSQAEADRLKTVLESEGHSGVVVRN